MTPPRPAAPAIQPFFIINNLAATPIIIAGSDEQKKDWLTRMAAGQLAAYAVTEPAAGSDVLGIQATATRRGSKYVLRGSKKFDKLGQRASDTAEIALDQVVLPECHRLGREGDGFMIAMKVFDRSRPTVAAPAVGLAQRALDESVKYAKERTAFGVPIGQHQAKRRFFLIDKRRNGTIIFV